ncbi:MAG: hypothetical protein FVQ81_07870 [Candidatus Glassbacteria bacterium]|nr:hypothetical protein [Candidatus Glassbacteria bacterium]
MAQKATMLLIIISASAGCSQQSTLEWQYTTDIDNDGKLELISVLDLNSNKRPDKIGDLHLIINKDTLEARLWSEAEFDLDGEPDELLIYIDRNGDGRVDTSEGWLWRCLDLDDDGTCDDRDSDLHELDLTGKGFAHQRIRYQDTDGDGDADLRCDYPTYNLSSSEQTYNYITGNRCMRQTWRGLIHGFGAWVYLDEDDDNLFPAHDYPFASLWSNLDADGTGTFQFRERHPRESHGMGLEGRRSTGEAHRWYDFDQDGFTDMHLRDYGSGMMRWSFDWDGDAPRRYSLDDPLKPIDAHVDYDVAFHTLGEVPRGWWAGDQLKLWDFIVGLDLPGYYRERGSAFDFGRDFVPASSSVYYTLHAPWRTISLNWLEDTEDAGRTKDVSSHRLESIWGYYYDFDPKTAFIGSRRDFDRDADSNFRIYLSPIDSLYHLYEAEDGIWYRDPDCRRHRFDLRPTEENIRRYAREIVTYSDADNDGFFDTFSYDRDLDGEADEVISKPESDQAEITDMTEIWRLGGALDSLYHPGVEDTIPVDFQVEVAWEETDYDLIARVRLSSSRPLTGYQFWLRAEEHVDYNILCRRLLANGKSRWEFSETIPKAQFILPGPTRTTALLVNNVGRIVGRYPVKEVAVEPLNSPAMHVGFYRAWSGKRGGGNSETRTRMGPDAVVRIGEWIMLEVGLEMMTSRERTLIFEPFLTDDSEAPRWPLGRKVYRMATGEIILTANLELVPFGQEVVLAAGNEAQASLPASLEDYLGIREQGDRVYLPPDRNYRIGFRLYIDGRLVENRILYYDWIKGIPQTIRVKSTSHRMD